MAVEETHSLDGRDVGDVKRAASCLSVPITSQEVARQIREATDPLTKQLEKLFDFMIELHRDTTNCNEGTSAPTQGPSGPRGERYDMGTGALLTTGSELLSGAMNPMMREPDHKTSTLQQPNRQQRPLLLEDADHETEQFNNSPIDHVVTSINNLPHLLQGDAAHVWIFNTQVYIF